MIWNDNLIRLLALNDMEVDVLKLLNEHKNVEDVVRATKYSRTGVVYCLRKLEKRGLVLAIKRGKKRLYISVDHSQLGQTLRMRVDEINISARKVKGAKVKTSPKDEFIIHVGAGEIGPAYSRIALMNKNERIKAIQHHRSFNMLQEKMTAKQLLEFNKAVIDNHLIIDGMLNESAYESYWEEIKHDPKKYEDVILSLGGRMADYNVFSDNVFNFDVEIWIFKTTTLLINWEQEVAIEIINADMTGFLRDMFEFVKKGGRKIDHNAFIKKLLKK